MQNTSEEPQKIETTCTDIRYCRQAGNPRLRVHWVLWGIGASYKEKKQKNPCSCFICESKRWGNEQVQISPFKGFG